MTTPLPSATPSFVPIRRWEGFTLVLSCLALAVPAAVYFALIAAHTENVPVADDFVILLPFATSWHEAASLWDRLALLWQQSNSHRIPCPLLVAAVVTAVHGDLQLVWLRVIGWSWWLALLASLFFSQRTLWRSPLTAFSASLLMMQPQGATNLQVAVQSVHYVGALLFAYWAFRLSLARPPTAFAFALVLAVVAMLSCANGLLVFPIATLLLVVLRHRRRAAVFALVWALAWAVYFIGYRFERHEFSAFEFLQNAAVMLGGAATFGRFGTVVATCAGTVIGLAGVWFVLRRRFWTAYPALTALLLHILLSVAMAANGRIGWSADYMLQDRYRIYGLVEATALGLILIAGTGGLRRRGLTAAFFTLSAIFCATSYLTTFSSVSLTGQWSRATAMNLQLGRSYLLPADEQIWAASADNLRRAQSAGVYRPPELLSPADAGFVRGLRNHPAGSPGPFQVQHSEGAQGYVLLADSLPVTLSPSDMVVAMFPDGPLLLAAQQIRLPLMEMITRWRFFSDRFACIIPSALYRPGAIPIHVLNRDDKGRLRVQWSAAVVLPGTAPIPPASVRTD